MDGDDNAQVAEVQPAQGAQLGRQLGVVFRYVINGAYLKYPSELKPLLTSYLTRVQRLACACPSSLCPFFYFCVKDLQRLAATA